MKRYCEFCKQEIEVKNYQQFGSHKGNCKFNPKYQDKIRKIKETKKLKRIKILKQCEKCDTNFEIERIILKDGEIKISNKERKFCSRSCANSHIQTKEQNEARSKKLRKTKDIKCLQCNKKFKPRSFKSKFCSNKCGGIYRKNLNKIKRKKRLLDIKNLKMEPKDNGYIKICGYNNHLNSDKRGVILEHRLIMSKKLKRPLKENEIVHHINENKSDNRIENLQLFNSQSEHTKEHKK
jgi:hypothetical protein